MHKMSIYLLAFSLITITLLMLVSIYYYLQNYWVNQKHLLPFQDTNIYRYINWKWGFRKKYINITKKNKEDLSKEARERYQNFSEEEKGK